MVTAEDLRNQAEFEDIREDVRLECAEHGQVLRVLIPRVQDGFSPALEGLIFVEFYSAGMAKSAAMVLNGRKFADKTVVVNYVSVWPVGVMRLFARPDRFCVSCCSFPVR